MKSIGYDYNQFDRLTYITSRDDHYKEPISHADFYIEHEMNPFWGNLANGYSKDNVTKEVMTSGKAICTVLRGIREYVAKNNGIPFDQSKCTHKGDCKGTCPKCESELESLVLQNALIPSSEVEQFFDNLIANLSEEVQQALRTKYVQPGNNWMTEGTCSRPEIYRATRGPLQGDLDTHVNRDVFLTGVIEIEDDIKLQLPPPLDELQIII